MLANGTSTTVIPDCANHAKQHEPIHVSISCSSGTKDLRVKRDVSRDRLSHTPTRLLSANSATCRVGAIYHTHAIRACVPMPLVGASLVDYHTETCKLALRASYFGPSNFVL
eukprot:4457737-Pyramimonas_sp.AAC.2